MLTRIFGQINSATSIFIGLLAAILAVGHFLFIQTPEFQITTAWGVFVFLPVVGYSIFAVGLVALLFGYQWLFEYKYKLVKRNAYFPFFLLVFVLIFSTNSGLDVLISLLFIGLVLGSWFAVYQGDKILGRTLNTGLVIGLGTLLDPKLSIMLLLSFVAYTVFGRFNGRAFLILIVGFLTIFMNSIALEYIFLGTNKVWAYYMQLVSFSSVQTSLEISVYQLALFGLLLLPALPEFANTLSRATVFKRQAYTILMVLVVVAASLLILRGSSVLYITMLIVSVLAIFVNYFQVMKRAWLQELVLWLLLGVLALFDLNII